MLITEQIFQLKIPQSIKLAISCTCADTATYTINYAFCLIIFRLHIFAKSTHFGN